MALARVLITEPKILLLDEPLSALDKKLREEMKYWIKGLQHSLGITTVYVTHDQGEALTMSDRIAVMNRAKIVQIGAPDTIYEHPADRFVTDFIGESNILEARVAAVSGDECRVAVGRVEFAAPRRDGIETGQPVGFVVRPERVLIGAAAEAVDGPKVTATVVDRSYQGRDHPLPTAARRPGGRRGGPQPARPARPSPTEPKPQIRLDRGEQRAAGRLISPAPAPVPLARILSPPTRLGAPSRITISFQ